MIKLSIKVLDRQGKTLAERSAMDEAILVYQSTYQEGDRIQICSAEPNVYLKVSVDDALGYSFIYLTSTEFTYHIPFGEKRSSYSPKSFFGNIHLLGVRLATGEEIRSYKNLALNVIDQHEAVNVYPHATANVETRGEAVFAARNAIDGVRENHSHGIWPYQSWGINRQDDAKMRLDFGRRVKIDKIILYTRSDFPHDNWWTNISFVFSDGTKQQWDLEKSDLPHILTFEEKTIEWLELCNLIKAEDPSPFPALSQIEVYGVEADHMYIKRVSLSLSNLHN